MENALIQYQDRYKISHLILEHAMINPTFYVSKAFKLKVEKCMNNTFGTLTQPFIFLIMTKKNTCVLALIMPHDTRQTKAKNVSEC